MQKVMKNPCLIILISQIDLYAVTGKWGYALTYGSFPNKGFGSNKGHQSQSSAVWI